MDDYISSQELSLHLNEHVRSSFDEFTIHHDTSRSEEKSDRSLIRQTRQSVHSDANVQHPVRAPRRENRIKGLEAIPVRVSSLFLHIDERDALEISSFFSSID